MKKPVLLLGAAFLVCLLPFIILCFLNVMASDDYLQYVGHRQYGFFLNQKLSYLLWAGRYTSTFVCNVFMVGGLSYRYYFLHSLLLFFFTWVGFLFLLRQLQGVLGIGKRQLLLASGVLFFLSVYVQAEIATGFYWFSSAMVYQLAFILFLVFAGLLIRRSGGAARIGYADIVPLIVLLLLLGCNELIAVFSLFFLLALAAGCYYFRRPVPSYLLLYLAVTAAAGILIMCTSGVITHRGRLMHKDIGVPGIAASLAFQTAATFYYIFKEPLFWVTAAAAFIWGSRLSRVEAVAFLKERNVFVPGLLALLFILVFTLGAVLVATSGSFPLRAMNNLTDLAACFLLILFMAAGIFMASGVHAEGWQVTRVVPAVWTTVLIVVLMANVNYLEAWRSVFSGYFYHAVMSSRDRQLQVAVEAHRKTDTVLDYEEARKEKIDQAFPHGVFASVSSLLLDKPALLYYFDGAGTRDPAYLNFYGLDSVNVRSYHKK